MQPPIPFHFRLETNEAIPAERALAVTAAMVKAIRGLPDFPNQAVIEIDTAGRGSWAANLLIYGAAGMTIATGVSQIIDLLKEDDSELAECVAWTIVEDGVSKVGIRCEGEHEVLRDEMPAVRALEARLAAQSMADHQSYQVAIDFGNLGLGKRDAQPEPENFETHDEPPVERSTEPVEFQVPDELPDVSDFTNIPMSPATIDLRGIFVTDGGRFWFIQRDGVAGKVSQFPGLDRPPENKPLYARVSAVRGSRGGFADRRVKVIEWSEQPLPDDTDGE